MNVGEAAETLVTHEKESPKSHDGMERGGGEAAKNYLRYKSFKTPHQSSLSQSYLQLHHATFSPTFFAHERKIRRPQNFHHQ